MKLEEVAGVRIWRRRQLSEIGGSSRCFKIGGCIHSDDHLFETKRFVGSMPKQTTKPAIAKVTSLSLPLT